MLSSAAAVFERFVLPEEVFPDCLREVVCSCSEVCFESLLSPTVTVCTFSNSDIFALPASVLLSFGITKVSSIT